MGSTTQVSSRIYKLLLAFSLTLYHQNFSNTKSCKVANTACLDLGNLCILSLLDRSYISKLTTGHVIYLKVICLVQNTTCIKSSCDKVYAVQAVFQIKGRYLPFEIRRWIDLIAKLTLNNETIIIILFINLLDKCDFILQRIFISTKYFISTEYFLDNEIMTGVQLDCCSV